MAGAARTPGPCPPRTIVDDAGVQVISVARPGWIFPFTGLPLGLVAERGGGPMVGGWPGWRWALDLADRVLLVAAYWRSNPTMPQLGPLPTSPADTSGRGHRPAPYLRLHRTERHA